MRNRQVLSALLGEHNVANVSLSALGGSFGLEHLIGKMAALIDEGHLGKFSNSSLIIERLKSITGGSKQSVNRKGISALPSVRLNIRFTMAVNELPRLSDSSAAMRSRLLVIPFSNSYEGREDIGLLDRLLSEVTGITNWALAGLSELRTCGRLINPSAGDEILREFVYLSSPVKAFIDECCNVGVDKQVRRNDLKLAWKVWSEDHGHMVGSFADFGKKLRAVVPKIKESRPSVSGQRTYYYHGLELNAETIGDINITNMVSY